MIDILKTKNIPGRPRKLIGSSELQRILLTEECLKRWAHLSIIKRCLKIKKLLFDREDNKFFIKMKHYATLDNRIVRIKYYYCNVR